MGKKGSERGGGRHIMGEESRQPAPLRSALLLVGRQRKSHAKCFNVKGRGSE